MPTRTSLAAALLLALTAASPAEPALSEDEAARSAADAYVFGYPLVLMELTRQVQTAVPKAGERGAPVNQFSHRPAFPDHRFTAVVSPNADTLYSIAWLNLAREPMVLSVPEMGRRYYLMQLLSAWTNVFASLGTRTSGNGQGSFAITGPGWKGQLPQGVREVRSPTDLVWLIGRTQTNGKDDYAAVHAIQKQYRLTPLSAWGKDYTPPEDVPVEKGVDPRTPPAEQVARLDAVAFFARLNALMKDNPPAVADAEALRRFAAVGVAPGRPFDLKTLDPVVARGVERGFRAGQANLAAAVDRPHGKRVNGWEILSNLGRYGTDYLYRAVIARVALGANLAEDAVYPRARVDAAGRPLTGKDRYVLRFPKGQLPPVNAFWSLTLYNSRQFFVQNPIDRYALGDRDRLKFNADGSLTLYLQHESPGPELESNWLPAPQDGFNLILRLYWPKQEALDGKWSPPPVERVE
jgi:hypothetical protein